MARYSAEELERVKRDSDLAGLARGAGVEFTQRGDELVGLCPFHSEQTPSFSVNVGTNVFHCFGCGAAGSVIDFVMRHRAVSFRNAVELLRQGTPVVEGTAGGLPPLFSEEQSDAEVMAAVNAHYVERFWRDESARQYATDRGLLSEKALRELGIGYSDRTLGYRLPRNKMPTTVAMRERLLRLGVLRDTGHEQLRGCLTFPLHDVGGAVVGLYGRRLDHGRAVVGPRHLYLMGGHRGVFNVANVRDAAEVILCEAVVDAATFYASGFSNVTCAYGVEGFTDEIAQAMSAAKRVYIAFDRDEAGERGAQKLAEKLMASGKECLRIKFPHGMDANGYAVTVAPADNALRILVSAAEWMGAGYKADVDDGKSPADKVNGSRQRSEVVPVPSMPPPPAESPTPSPTKPPLTTLVVAPTSEVTLPADTLEAEEHHFQYGERRYRVRGLKGNTGTIVMKVNVGLRATAAYYVDTFDMLMSRARGHFVKMAATEIGVDEAVVKQDVGSMLEQLEAIQEMRRQRLLEGAGEKSTAPVMTEEEQAEAIAFLKDPRLVERIRDDLERVGLVGENTNKLVCYVAAVSRKQTRPLAIIIRSNSGAGKSSLMDTVLNLMPDEEVEKYSAMTSQALYYMGETSLRHKILALAEEEGAEKTVYALKLLQSEGELTIASTGKDPVSGRHETKEYHVEGPVMVFVTTTKAEPDEEFLNRCLVLTVDESREQTRAIHRAQKMTATKEGILQRLDRVRIVNLHRNAQRLLKPLAVQNPYSQALSFPDHEMRTRRDLPKYMALIEAITLLFQHQREVQELVSEHGEVVETVLTTKDDIALANRLMVDILGQTLDELQPQTRRLLNLVSEMVKEKVKRDAVKRDDVRFSLREVRESTGWGHTQLQLHMARLVERELLILHRGGPGQRFFYELAYDGEGVDGKPFIAGLFDVDKLGLPEATGPETGGFRPGTGGVPAPGVDVKTPHPNAKKPRS